MCPDLRGHGLSGWPEEGYCSTSFVDNLEEIAEDAELEAFDLVGHSLGARIAIAFAAAHPEAVRRTRAVRHGAKLPPKANLFTKKIVGSIGGDVRGFANAEQAYAYYRERHPEWQERFIDLHVEHQVRRNWAGKLVFRRIPTCSGCSDPPEAATMRDSGTRSVNARCRPWSCGVSAATSSPERSRDG